MPDSHGTGGDDPSTSNTGGSRGRFRARAVAAGAFVAVVTGGLTLAVACGGTDGGADKGRAEGSARPSGTQSHSPSVSRAPSTPHSPSSSAASSPAAGWDPSPSSIAAVGDSITRGFDACSLLSDCTRVSWATGGDSGVRSLADRLLDDPSGDSWNFAATGSVMADLPAQMKRAAARDPAMVTVLTGANDACSRTVGQMTDIADFRDSFRLALRTLRDEQPQAQVYVASVPDLKRLWSQGRKNPDAKRAWAFGICPSMLSRPDATTPASNDRRDAVRERVMAYNEVLREECAEFSRCRYDNGAVFNYPFTERELSKWDWFHPGAAGQRELAALAHREIVSRR